MNQEVGAPLSGTGSRASTEPSSTVSALSGFDPSRVREVFPIGGFAPGNYLGACHRCKRTMWNVDKRSASCFDCAIIAMKAHAERLEGALRIRFWNDAKGKGLSDDLAMMFVAEQMRAIVDRNPKGEDGETRLRAEHESDGGAANRPESVVATPKGEK